VISGQSCRRSKSSKRRFVTKSRISDAGIGFNVWGLVFVLTDIARERPLVVVVVAVEAVEVDRDIFGS
jgi:hypothetical protein